MRVAVYPAVQNMALAAVSSAHHHFSVQPRVFLVTVTRHPVTIARNSSVHRSNAWLATCGSAPFHALGGRSPCCAANLKPLVTRAGSAAAAGHGLLDLGIVSAAGQASFKLLFLCAVVAWMSERSMIPANASQVMSKVSGQPMCRTAQQRQQHRVDPHCGLTMLKP